MDLTQLLVPALCFPKLEGRSQKRVFETVAEEISAKHPELVYTDIFDALTARERLGSTGLGEGVAIPHCRIGCDGQGIAAIVTLSEPIDFDSPDQRPVDLLVFLMVPGDATQAHLDILAQLAKALSVLENQASLRDATTSQELYNILIAAIES